jgi:hypothetical protein
MSTMFAKSRIRSLVAPALVLAALALALPGCEEDLKPKITKLTATPQCDVVKTVTQVNIDPNDSSIVTIDTLGTWMEVRFFARASSGNELGDPTGANSPLEWRWDFGDGQSASNVVGPVHRYYGPSDDPLGYLVTLSVKDDDGDEDTASLRVLVGEAYTDLDILSVGIDPIPELTFRAVPGSVAMDLTQTWGTQLRVDRMEMVFDGMLQSSCSVSGLFEQYLWEWTIVEPATADTTRLVDRDPAQIRYSPSYRQLEALLEVTEAVTGIYRFVADSTLNPVGLRVGYTEARTTVPNGPEALELEGHLLQGVTEMHFELEWADSAAAYEGVEFTPAIEAGFTATADSIGPGRVAVSLTNPGGYPGTETLTTIGTLRLTTNDVVPGEYPVRVRVPFAMRDADPDPASGAPFTTVDGGIRLDTDCDGDQIPDSFQAEYFPGLYDCNGNGVHDICDIEDGTSSDENGNGIPDECEG